MLSEDQLKNSTDDITVQSAEHTLEQCDQLMQFIEATLDVSEAEAGVGSVEFNAVNISEIVIDACDLFHSIAEEKEISMPTDLDENCEVKGARHQLQKMIANILDNAIKYTPEHGEVSVRLDKNKETVRLTVSDTGPGVPEPEQDRIFERYYRCDQSRGIQEGHGLGLSYALAVARIHQGNIILDSKPGVGSVFTIELPVGS